ncbi:7434_t:CDS:2, partial [Funneliformis mosseae]
TIKICPWFCTNTSIRIFYQELLKYLLENFILEIFIYLGNVITIVPNKDNVRFIYIGVILEAFDHERILIVTK